jgi:membrane protein implicated in regulation of membrane protease activity
VLLVMAREKWSRRRQRKRGEQERYGERRGKEDEVISHITEGTMEIQLKWRVP